MIPSSRACFVALMLVGCGRAGDGDSGEAGMTGDTAPTCTDGCIPDFGKGDETTETSGDESGASTGTGDTDGTDATTESDETAGTTTEGGDDCPPDAPDGDACGGQLACAYGDLCCLCDPDMGCDTWTCSQPFGGVFCPDEHPGVGAPCPMEAISCSYCVAEDPALFCTGGEWTPISWCF